MIEIVVNLNDANQTLIKFLKKIIDYKSQKVNFHKIIRTKKIKINDKIVKNFRYKLNHLDVIKIYYDLVVLKQRDVIFDIYEEIKVIFEDDNLLIVFKESDLLIHNAYGDSLDNRVKNYLIKKNEYHPEQSQSFVISHIHRIDKLTSGLVIYAKNKKTLDYFLSKIDKEGFIEKYYLLECEGHFEFNDLELSGYIFKDEEDKKMYFSRVKIENSKSAITIFKKIKNKSNSTILEAKLVTGRKNQIRAAMEFLNHSIVNDFKYGAQKISAEKKINLVAYKIKFNNLDNGFEYLNNKIICVNAKFN